MANPTTVKLSANAFAKTVFLDIRCRHLVYKFYELYDQAHYAEVAANFTQDGYWLRGGKHLRGRGEILAALQKRPSNRRSLHSVTNLQVIPSEAGFQLRYWLTIYRSDEVHQLGEFAPIVGPALILSATAQIAICGEELLFTHKELQREFSMIS